MITPELRRLESLGLTRDQARLIKRIGRSTHDRSELERLIERHCDSTHRYARSCHSDPYATLMWRTTLALHAIDTILGTHGVEPLGGNSYEAPPYEYCNTGDPYSATLIYKRSSDRLFVGSWGDIIDQIESALT